MVRFVIILFCLAIPGLPQGLTIGAEGGLRLTGDVPPYGTSNSKRYLVGPTIEIGLPFHFAFEVDALYSRLGNTFYFPLIANESDMRTIANSWEFPLLAKYRIPVSRVTPFGSIGLAPRHATGSIHTIHYGFLPGDITFSSTTWHARDHAFVLGGGIRVGVGHLRITPEVRYLRWAVPSGPSSWNVAYYLPTPQDYEVQLLLGIGWTSKGR